MVRVVQEQIVARMGATAPAETCEQCEDMDLSDCKDVAKELSRHWIAAVKNVAKLPHLKALQDACARTPRRTLSDAGKVDPKGGSAAPAAAGADKDTAEGKKDKTTEEDLVRTAAPAAQTRVGTAAPAAQTHGRVGGSPIRAGLGGDLVQSLLLPF